MACASRLFPDRLTFAEPPPPIRGAAWPGYPRPQTLPIDEQNLIFGDNHLARQVRSEALQRAWERTWTEVVPKNRYTFLSKFRKVWTIYGK
jgi:hypothetical protein